MCNLPACTLTICTLSDCKSQHLQPVCRQADGQAHGERAAPPPAFQELCAAGPAPLFWAIPALLTSQAQCMLTAPCSVNLTPNTASVLAKCTQHEPAHPTQLSHRCMPQPAAHAYRLSQHRITCNPHRSSLHPGRQNCFKHDSEKLWAQAQLLIAHVGPRAISVVQVSAVCPDIRGLQGTKTWHVMVSSGTPGDSVQLLRPPPTQLVEPSTAHVREAAQPAAQLDAKSQR